MIRLNAEAKEFIERLEGFDVEAFDQFIKMQTLGIGTAQILQFIEERKRWNTIPVDNGSDPLRFVFSPQAKKVVSRLGSAFNEQEFRIWFSNGVQFTKTDVIGYIESQPERIMKILQ